MRKFFIIFVMLIFVSVNVHAQEVPDAHGLALPFPEYQIDDGCLGWGSYNNAFPGAYHVADDECSSAGTQIYASAKGLVRYARFHRECGDPNNPGGWGYIIVIESKVNGESICIVYGHINPIVEEGTIVTIGQPIGEIDQGGSCWSDHIHFGIYKGQYAQANGQYPGWLAGYISIDTWPGNYVDPVQFIVDHPVSQSIVGHFSDGTISNEIIQKYNDMSAAGHSLGDPWQNPDGGWTSYVHDLNGMLIQDFKDLRDEGGSSNGYYNPYTAIIYDHDDPWTYRVPRLLKEGFWDAWMTHVGWESLGVPVTNEISSDGHVYQRFYRFGDNYVNNPSDYETFYLRWDEGSQELIAEDANHVYLPWAELTIEASSPSGVLAGAQFDDIELIGKDGPVVDAQGDSGGGASKAQSKIRFNDKAVVAVTSQSDGVYHSEIRVADFGQPFGLLDQNDYDDFYVVLGGGIIPIDPFTMNGDMTIYIDSAPPGAEIVFDYWYITPNPGMVGTQIRVEGGISNIGGSTIVLPEVRVEFLGTNGQEVYHWSEYNVELYPGDQWYQWLYCNPYDVGNHTARFRVYINGQWQTYATQAIYVQEDPDRVVAAFSGIPRSGYAPLTVQFADESTGNPNDWQWLFGDGSVLHDVQHPTHTYHNPGVYEVDLLVRNANGGGDRVIVTDYITVTEVPMPCVDGHVNMPNYPGDLKVVGNYSYVASTVGGLQIVDISDPMNMSLVGGIESLGITYTVDIQGNYAYVSDFNSGLRIVDISNPSSPTLIKTVETPGQGRGVAVSGNYAYVADGTAGFQVIDISNPQTAFIIGSLTVTGHAHNAVVFDGYVYLLAQSGGLYIIDVSNPSNPTIVRRVDTPGSAHDVVFVGNYAYVADFSEGLQVVNISDPLSATIVASISDLTYAYALDISGDIVYLTDRDYGIHLINVSNPSDPMIVGSIEISSNIYDIFVSNDHAYASVANRLLSVPLDCGVVLSADFVADSTEVDTNDLVQFTGQANGSPVAWAWDFGDGEISLEQNPMHDYQGSGTYTVQMAAIYAEGSIFIVRENYITVTQSIEEPDEPMAFEVNVSSGAAPLYVYFTNQSSIEAILWFWDFGDGGTAMSEHASHTYMSPGSYSVTLYAFTSSMETLVYENYINVGVDKQIHVTSLNKNYPNPFNPSTTINFSLDKAQSVKIAIYDVSGRRIAQLTDRVFEAGAHSVQWLGKDQSGQSVSTGIYFVQMKTLKGVESKKITLIK